MHIFIFCCTIQKTEVQRGEVTVPKLQLHITCSQMRLISVTMEFVDMYKDIFNYHMK